MAMLAGTKHYTAGQIDWIIRKSQMSKYRSSTGRKLKRAKLHYAFNREFKQNRPIDGFGVSVRRMIDEASGIKRDIMPERKVVERVIRTPLTLDTIETKLRGILAMIDTVKGFMKL